MTVKNRLTPKGTASNTGQYNLFKRFPVSSRSSKLIMYSIAKQTTVASFYVRFNPSPQNATHSMCMPYRKLPGGQSTALWSSDFILGPGCSFSLRLLFPEAMHSPELVVQEDGQDPRPPGHVDGKEKNPTVTTRYRTSNIPVQTHPSYRLSLDPSITINKEHTNTRLGCHVIHWLNSLAVFTHRKLNAACSRHTDTVLREY